MDAINLLIVFALVAWGLQIGLGFFQVRAFNRMLQDMSLKGSVKIGRTASRWRPRTLVVLAHDANGVIVDAKIMRGLTIFARPQTPDAGHSGACPYPADRATTGRTGTAGTRSGNLRAVNKMTIRLSYNFHYENFSVHS